MAAAASRSATSCTSPTSCDLVARQLERVTTSGRATVQRRRRAAPQPLPARNRRALPQAGSRPRRCRPGASPAAAADMPAYVARLARAAGSPTFTWRPGWARARFSPTVQDRSRHEAELRSALGQSAVMTRAIVTGPAGLIGSRDGPHFCAKGLRRGRHRQRHAGLFLRGRGARRECEPAAARGPCATYRHHAGRHPRSRGRASSVFRQYGRRRSSWWCTPRPSPRTTGPAREPLTDFAVNATGT